MQPRHDQPAFDLDARPPRKPGRSTSLEKQMGGRPQYGPPRYRTFTRDDALGAVKRREKRRAAKKAAKKARKVAR